MQSRIFAACVIWVFLVGHSIASDKVVIEQFAQEGDGSVNSWILLSDDRMVLIDSQRSLSAGIELATLLKAKNRPLEAILLTHPHPDHFGGLASVLKAFPNTPVMASAATTKMMETDGNGFIALTKKVLGDDAPDEQPTPTVEFSDKEKLSFGAIELIAHEMGSGEADSMSVFHMPNLNAVFVGDVLDNQMTGFVMEGQSGDWLKQLDTVDDKFGKASPVIYPGHGDKGEFGVLLAAQKEWLQSLRDLVSERLSDGFTEEEAKQVSKAMSGKYPDHPPVAAVPNLMMENAKAVAKELAGD